MAKKVDQTFPMKNNFSIKNAVPNGSQPLVSN